MTQRIVAFSLLVGFLLSVISARPVSAISWDDGGSNKLWGNLLNWSPNGVPTPSDVGVFIGNLPGAANDQVLVDAPCTITHTLEITNGAGVINSTDNGATNAHELIVNGETLVSGAGSSLTIYGGAPDGLDTDTLTIEEGGKVFLNSQSAQGTAVLEVDDGLLSIHEGGLLSGNGVIELLDSVDAPTVLLSNQGTISVGELGGIGFGTPAHRTLQITATDPNARFAWIGSIFATGEIQIRGNGTLDIDVQPSSNFATTMSLSTGATIDVAHSWDLTFGTINVNTQAFITVIGSDPLPGPAAHIAGAHWTMTDGTIYLEDSWDSLHVDSSLSATSGTIENSGTITFNAPASFQSGVDFNMNGAGASLVVNAGVNIATPDFNLDGVGLFGNVTTINSGGVLNLGLGVGADENFDHTINLNGGQLQVATVDNAWGLSSFGVVHVASGATSIISGEEFLIGGFVDVTANSTLSMNAVSHYSDTAQVVIATGSTLLHNANSTIGAGASYSGGGSLVNAAGNTLLLLDNADVQVRVVNEGTLVLENFAGQTSGLDFEQTNSGVWDLQIGGLATGSFDQMILSGSAQLDGTLDVSRILGFIPTLGDTFDILSAAGGVLGVFDSIIQPLTMPNGLEFGVNYLGSTVQLEVIDPSLFTADFDNDGDVDADDLAKWKNDFGGPGSDADGDGDTDGSDFLAWQRQFGSGVSAVVSSTNVPEPTTFFLTSLAACFGLLSPRTERTT